MQIPHARKHGVSNSSQKRQSNGLELYFFFYWNSLIKTIKNCWRPLVGLKINRVVLQTALKRWGTEAPFKKRKFAQQTRRLRNGWFHESELECPVTQRIFSDKAHEGLPQAKFRMPKSLSHLLRKALGCDEALNFGFILARLPVKTFFSSASTSI